MNRLSQDRVDVSHALQPSVECFQTASEVVIVAHLPGIVKDEVKIEGSENSVAIKIVGPSDPEQIARMGYYSHEVVKLYGFSHTVNLPSKINFASAKATFKHGVLEVRAPKLR